jgi:hypothetical protein
MNFYVFVKLTRMPANADEFVVNSLVIEFGKKGVKSSSA